MPGELAFPLGTLVGFLLVLARVAGTFVFVPIPGVRSGPEMARVVLVVAVTVSLFPLWPAIDPATIDTGRLVGWLLAEASLGVGIGVAVAFLTEAFLLAAQTLGLQAGYAYASTIDPNTEADSSVLLVLSQLIAGMLFFASGIHRELIRAFARSLETHPPGGFVLTRFEFERIAQLGADMFTTGMRLAFPVVVLLALVDVSLALLGRVNAQLQLLTLAFPVKMLAALALLAWLMLLFPAVYRAWGGEVIGVVRATFAR
jgi:flagellar biosynthesis protein FliR